MSCQFCRHQIIKAAAKAPCPGDVCHAYMTMHDNVFFLSSDICVIHLLSCHVKFCTQQVIKATLRALWLGHISHEARDTYGIFLALWAVLFSSYAVIVPSIPVYIKLINGQLEQYDCIMDIMAPITTMT